MSMQKARREARTIGQGPAVTRQGEPDTSVMAAGAVLANAWQRYALQLLKSRWNAPPMSMGVTSIIRGEGRTTASVGLAVAIAEETSSPVVLLGLDSRGYGLAEAFGLLSGPDLEGVLCSTWTVEAAVTQTRVRNLAVLPASTAAARPNTASDRIWFQAVQRLPAILDELKQDFSYIVCDMPPLLGESPTSGLAQRMDALVLLTRAGMTPLQKLEEGLALLDHERLTGVAHIGAPMTNVPKWVASLLLE